MLAPQLNSNLYPKWSCVVHALVRHVHKALFLQHYKRCMHIFQDCISLVYYYDKNYTLYNNNKYIKLRDKMVLQLLKAFYTEWTPFVKSVYSLYTAMGTMNNMTRVRDPRHSTQNGCESREYTRAVYCAFHGPGSGIHSFHGLLGSTAPSSANAPPLPPKVGHQAPIYK